MSSELVTSVAPIKQIILPTRDQDGKNDKEAFLRSKLKFVLSQRLLLGSSIHSPNVGLRLTRRDPKSLVLCS